MNEETIQFQSLTHASYLLQRGDKQAPLFILLHGYKSHSNQMKKWLLKRLPQNANVLIPNAPYPIPYKDTQGNLRLGYSWYFFDPTTKKYIIDYSICKDYIKNLTSKLGFNENKKIIIGWSQGGYASVHITEALKNVTHIIGMGCQFKIKTPKWQSPLKVDAIHGKNDTTVNIDEAKKHFAKLPEKTKGRFKELKETGHTPTIAMLEQVANWAKETQ